MAIKDFLKKDDQRLVYKWNHGSTRQHCCHLLLLACCYCDVKNFKGTLTKSFLCLHHLCPLITSGYSALLRLPGFHLRYDNAARSQLRGHGPLCKVFPDPAAGGQPGGGGAQLSRGGRQGLEGSASRPGVTADGSLRLRSDGLDWLQSMKPNTDINTSQQQLEGKVRRQM